MVRAFHWQYGDILLAIYFFVFTYYFVLSLKNKYSILYYYTSLPLIQYGNERKNIIFSWYYCNAQTDNLLADIWSENMSTIRASIYSTLQRHTHLNRFSSFEERILHVKLSTVGPSSVYQRLSVICHPDSGIRLNTQFSTKDL